jgi:hypothetical protein
MKLKVILLAVTQLLALVCAHGLVFSECITIVVFVCVVLLALGERRIFPHLTVTDCIDRSLQSPIITRLLRSTAYSHHHFPKIFMEGVSCTAPRDFEFKGVGFNVCGFRNLLLGTTPILADPKLFVTLSTK